MICIHCGYIYPPTTDHPDRFQGPECPGRPQEGKEEIAPQALFNTKELQALFGDYSDRTLVGNRLKEVFEKIGIPPCASCNDRATWMNQAHLILRKAGQVIKNILP